MNADSGPTSVPSQSAFHPGAVRTESNRLTSNHKPPCTDFTPALVRGVSSDVTPALPSVGSPPPTTTSAPPYADCCSPCHSCLPGNARVPRSVVVNRCVGPNTVSAAPTVAIFSVDAGGSALVALTAASDAPVSSYTPAVTDAVVLLSALANAAASCCVLAAYAGADPAATVA